MTNHFHDSYPGLPPSHGGEENSARKPQPLRTGLILTLLLCLAVVIRLLSFHGYAGSDDGSYAKLAHSMAAGTFRVGDFVGPPVFPLRVGVFAPVAALFRLFGAGEWATIAYPFALSLSTILLAFYAGRLLFGTTAGLLAAALQTVLPMASRSATILMPDLPAAFWANLGVVLLLVGSRKDLRSQKILYGSLCGIALGVSWLCKETVAYLVPFLVVVTAWQAFRSRVQAPLALTILAVSGAVVVMEALIYWRITGDPLHRIHEMHRNYEYNSTWFFAEGSRFGWEPGQYHAALLKRLFRDGPQTLLGSPSYGGVTVVALVAAAYACFHRRKEFALVGAWFVWLLLVFNFGSSSLRQYQPLVLFDKYGYPLLFPACLLTSGLLAILLEGHSQRQARQPSDRKFWGLALTAGLLGACAVVTAENVWSGRKSSAERIAARVISPRDPLYTDSRTLRVMEFFWSFPKQLAGVDFSGLSAADIPAGAYVLVNRNKLRLLENYYEYGAPSFCTMPPSEWEVISQSKDVVLYRTPIDDLARVPPRRLRPHNPR